MKFILKLLACLFAVGATLLGIAYWNKITAPEYVKIYSDDEDLF